MLPTVLNTIFSHDGVITGSYVRDIMVLGDKFSHDRDIDVLIPYSSIRNLANEMEDKFAAVTLILDDDPDEEIAHYNFIINDEGIECHNFVIDVFACGNDYCYLSPADFDVNTLTWNGSDYGTWFRFSPEDDDFYGVSFDIQDLLHRCKKKKAVFLSREWAWRFQDENISILNDDHIERQSKLLSRGWKLI